ncbi:sugar phosphate isomerase/epimerase family protein [Zhihengliuella sp.]|uniref:sugar phosphate isomerase/epimerase family protein n=1 Tax=Zhihengliuella sp. TaxID=1954483 RepID=UPI0028113A40|nr:sugar phosphate isomerase/epimerase family protein [Zhihengliuella sp.]
MTLNPALAGADTRPEPGAPPGPPGWTSAAWPIGASMMSFPGALGDGTRLTDASAERWRPALREVAAAGFDHVDLTDSWIRPGDLTAGSSSELLATAAEFGLAFSAISVTRQSVVDPDPDVAEANLQYSLRTVEGAARLGIGVVCLGLHRPLTEQQLRAQWFWHAPGAEDPDDAAVRRTAVDRFRRIGERAGELGVEISLELYEGTYLEAARDSVEFVEEIGLPNVGLNPDLGNIVRLHRPVEHWEQMLETMLPHTNYWHVKNYFRDFDPATGAYFTAPAPMELGYINYRRAIEMALDAGFAGPICVEHYGGDGLSVSALNRDYIRRILAVKLGE